MMPDRRFHKGTGNNTKTTGDTVMTAQPLAKPSIFSMRFTAITATASLVAAIAAKTSAGLG